MKVIMPILFTFFFLFAIGHEGIRASCSEPVWLRCYTKGSNGLIYREQDILLSPENTIQTHNGCAPLQCQTFAQKCINNLCLTLLPNFCGMEIGKTHTNICSAFVAGAPESTAVIVVNPSNKAMKGSSQTKKNK